MLIGHNYSLKNSDSLGVSELVIEDSDIAIFNSPFQYEGENIKGLVLNHEIKLTENNTGAVLQLIEDLAKAEAWDWDEHPTLAYGKITELLPIEEAKEQEKEAAAAENTE